MNRYKQTNIHIVRSSRTHAKNEMFVSLSCDRIDHRKIVYVRFTTRRSDTQQKENEKEYERKTIVSAISSCVCIYFFLFRCLRLSRFVLFYNFNVAD